MNISSQFQRHQSGINFRAYPAASAQQSQKSRIQKTSTGSKIRLLSQMIVELPEGGSREIVSESFTAIINGKADIKRLQMQTIAAAKQLRTMYLSGNDKALLADARWRIREYVWETFAIQLTISPCGLFLAEGNNRNAFGAFLNIDASGQVSCGETYEDAPLGPQTYSLTPEEFFERLSERLLNSVFED